MNSVNLVVQARMGSVRLPGKMMLDLYGKPILYRILNRLKRCQLIDNVILAIPDNSLNDILEEVGTQISGVKIFRGSESNLIERFQQAIYTFPCDFVIRFPGDNVFPDPAQIDNLIRFHIKNNQNGFSSNLASVFGNKMIDGVGAEIFSSRLLMNLCANTADAAQKEHLHLNFYDYARQLAVREDVDVLAPKPPAFLSRPEFALDINYVEQYSLIREIYRNVFRSNEEATTKDIIKYLDEKE